MVYFNENVVQILVAKCFRNFFFFFRKKNEIVFVRNDSNIVILYTATIFLFFQLPSPLCLKQRKKKITTRTKEIVLYISICV